MKKAGYSNWTYTTWQCLAARMILGITPAITASYSKKNQEDKTHLNACKCVPFPACKHRSTTLRTIYMYNYFESENLACNVIPSMLLCSTQCAVAGACSVSTRPIVLNGQRGEFASPSYPNHYPNNADCLWRLESTGAQTVNDVCHWVQTSIWQFTVTQHEHPSFKICSSCDYMFIHTIFSFVGKICIQQIAVPKSVFHTLQGRNLNFCMFVVYFYVLF